MTRTLLLSRDGAGIWGFIAKYEGQWNWLEYRPGMIQLGVGMEKNYQKANFTLGVATVGFLLAYPWHASFWGGLLSSGFSAAMIGGMADWFAVNALFRRPLGVRPGRIIRTEIIPRNREKIFIALANMVQNELLTKENLKNHLSSYNFSVLFLRYWQEHGGRHEILKLMDNVIDNGIVNIEPKALGQFLEKLCRAGLVNIKASPLAAEIVQYSIQQGYLNSLIDFVVEELAKLPNHPQVTNLTFQLAKEALSSYEKGMERRKFVNDLILEVSPVKLSEEVQKWLSNLLGDIKHNQAHPARQYIRARVEDLAASLEAAPALQARFEAWKNQTVVEKLNIAEELGAFSALWLEKARPWLQETLTAQVDRLLSRFKADCELQLQVDQWVKAFLLRWVDRRHHEIGNMVQERLNKLSDAMLVELIEEKAGNDLQMIRINGSLVGGLAGLLIYLVTYAMAI